MILDKPFNVGHFGEKGQTCIIYSVDVHPDGRRFATGGADHRIKIWSMEPFRTPAAPSDTTVKGGRGDHPGDFGALLAQVPPSTQVEDEVSLLAVLSQHTESVNRVRWSHDGRSLASASDDKYVLIWELRPGAASSAPFGSNDAPNVENWTRVWVLGGHGSNVLDCAWSPNDSMLASCSMDNTVVVWRMPEANGEGGAFGGTSIIVSPFRTLRRHESYVKGVAWDPMGRFLASIGGEDNSLMVWRVGGDWGVETTLKTPFEGCEETLVRRISWSPDGRCLVATNSKDRDVHRAVVFFRGQWKEKPTSLVGNSACTLVASFSPVIYYKPSDAASTTGAANGGGAANGTQRVGHQVVAVAGQDKVLTVWLATAKRPVAVLRDVFDKPPSDLAWGADGYTLVASGYDGTVVLLRFSPEELGKPLPEADRAAHFVKMYGAGAAVPGGITLALDGAPSLVDNPRQLALERSQQTAKKDTVTPSAPKLGNTGEVHVNTLIARSRLNQKESRGHGGKRRIQPTLMSNGASAISPSAAPRPPVPRWAGTSVEGGGGTVSEGFESSPNGHGEAAATSRSNGSGVSGNSHKRPRTGGSSTGHFSSPLRQYHSSSGVVGVRQQTAAVVRIRPSAAAAGGLLSSSSTSSHLPFVSPPELMPRRGASGSLVRQISGGAVAAGDGAFRPPPRLRETSSIEGERNKGGAVEVGSGLGLGMGNPTARTDSEVSGVGNTGREKVAVLECSALESEFRGLPARRYTLVAVTRGGREVWRDYVAGTVTACCGNTRVAAVGAEDGSVYVYDRSGTRCAPPLIVSPPVAYLECSDSLSSSARRNVSLPGAISYNTATPPYTSTSDGGGGGDQLMAISGDGDVIVWNLRTMTLTTKSSLAPLFRSVSASSSSGINRQNSATSGTSSPPGSPVSGRQACAGSSASGGAAGAAAAAAKATVSVARAGVTAEGMPVVMLACPGAFGGSLQAFALHEGLGTWLRVADGRFALSDFYSSGPCTASSKGGVLTTLQAGVRTSSTPTPAALLQASRVGVGSAAGGGMARPSPVAGTAAAAAAVGRRESLRAAVTRGHLEDSLATAVLLGSADEFVDVLRSYAGHLAKSAGLGDGRIRALCDKLLLASDVYGLSGRPPAVGDGELAFGNGPSVLGLTKLSLLKEVVLPALSGNRSLQRLVSEYYDGLELSSRAVPPNKQRLSIASSPSPQGPDAPSSTRTGSSSATSAAAGSHSLANIAQQYVSFADESSHADVVGSKDTGSLSATGSSGNNGMNAAHPEKTLAGATAGLVERLSAEGAMSASEDAGKRGDMAGQGGSKGKEHSSTSSAVVNGKGKGKAKAETKE